MTDTPQGANDTEIEGPQDALGETGPGMFTAIPPLAGTRGCSCGEADYMGDTCPDCDERLCSGAVGHDGPRDAGGNPAITTITTVEAPHICGPCGGTLKYNGRCLNGYATWVCGKCDRWHCAEGCCTPTRYALDEARAREWLTAAVAWNDEGVRQSDEFKCNEPGVYGDWSIDGEDWDASIWNDLPAMAWQVAAIDGPAEPFLWVDPDKDFRLAYQPDLTGPWVVAPYENLRSLTDGDAVGVDAAMAFLRGVVDAGNRLLDQAETLSDREGELLGIVRDLAAFGPFDGTGDALDYLAGLIGRARQVAARHPQMDTWSSASRQHYIETGRYLPVDETPDGGPAGYTYRLNLDFTTTDPDHSELLNRLQAFGTELSAALTTAGVQHRLNIVDATPGAVTDRDVLSIDTVNAGDPDPDAAGDDDLDVCRVGGCDNRLDDGEGWDGICGPHADAAEDACPDPDCTDLECDGEGHIHPYDPVTGNYQ